VYIASIIRAMRPPQTAELSVFTDVIFHVCDSYIRCCFITLEMKAQCPSETTSAFRPSDAHTKTNVTGAGTDIALKTEAVRIAETSVYIYKTARRLIPEVCHRNFLRLL
jgi:hypothetical protein